MSSIKSFLFKLSFSFSFSFSFISSIGSFILISIESFFPPSIILKLNSLFSKLINSWLGVISKLDKNESPENLDIFSSSSFNLGIFKKRHSNSLDSFKLYVSLLWLKNEDLSTDIFSSTLIFNLLFDKGVLSYR